MKHIYRFLILVIVFSGSVLLFGSRIATKSFSKTTETVEIAEAVLPTMTVETCGETLGCLYGYTTNLDATLNRENLIPLDATATFELVLDEYDMSIRRLKYEILDVMTGAELESATVNAFEKKEDQKMVRVRVKTDLSEGTEYAVKVTLVNNVGKKIYYYFRIKKYASPKLTEKLAFLREFEANTRSSDTADNEKIIPFLEMKADAPSDTFGYLNIHSGYRLVCYGDLTPEPVTETVYTITEFYNEIMTAVAKSVIALDAGYGKEYYIVEEHFRIRYLGAVVHLLNYERYTESVFDATTASVSLSDLKLGILGNGLPQLYPSADSGAVSFVRNGALYTYNLANNTISEVFSGTKQWSRLLGMQDGYDLQVLKTEANGNLIFFVNGYRNRGGYEGRVGLFLYRYHVAEGQLEELVYIPVGTTAQILREEAGSFAYLNDVDVLYFMMNRNLYSYNLITEELTVLAEKIAKDNYVFSAEEHYLAYQEDGRDDSICVLFPETGEIREIRPKSGEYIRLLGKSENNVICGYGRPEDRYTNEDETITEALYEVKICTSLGEVRKAYQKAGFYVDSVETDANVICLNRLVKQDNGYKTAESDYILILEHAEGGRISIAKRITEQLLTEYYITFPDSFEMGTLPTQKEAVLLVTDKDPALRLGELTRTKREFFVYSYGAIASVGSSLSDAIQTADALAATVIGSDGRVLWERGVKATSANVGNVTEVRCTSNQNSIQAAAAMLLSANGITAEISAEEALLPFAQLLENCYSGQLLSMSGVTLDQALYYVWKGKPVVVLSESNTAVVIVGYTSREIIYFDPVKGKKVTMEKESAERKFSAEHSYYFSYLN